MSFNEACPRELYLSQRCAQLLAGRGAGGVQQQCAPDLIDQVNRKFELKQLICKVDIRVIGRAGAQNRMTQVVRQGRVECVHRMLSGVAVGILALQRCLARRPVFHLQDFGSFSPSRFLTDGKSIQTGNQFIQDMRRSG